MVGIYRCEKYDENELEKVVDKLFFELGFDKMITQGMNVVLKPNLLAKRKPSEAATSHPLFIKAVAKKVISLGANCTLCDSAGGNYTEGSLENLYRYNELKPLERIGVKLNYDTSSEYVNIGGKILSSVDIISPILNADLVINLPVVKTHVIMNLTCASKNMFGIVPGFKKAEIHSRFPNYEDFASALVDISVATKNQISIADGIIGHEGNGPSGGNPRKLGIILGSKNQFELDYIACKIIGMDVNDAYMVAESIKRNLIEPSNIKVIGEKVEDVKVTDFKFPDTTMKRAAKFAFSFVKIIKPYPIFNKQKCKLCKICIESCPRKAIYIKKDRVRLIKKKCIRCFCCQELCPYKAISIKHIIKSLLFRKEK